MENPIGYALNFRNQLINNSVSKDFKTAAKEWQHVTSYEIDSNDFHCICGKNIYNINVIYNEINNIELQIGSECAKHISQELTDKCKTAHKLIKKISDFITNQEQPITLSDINFQNFKFKESELTTLFILKIITEWEYNFIASIYSALKKYKKYTPKQYEIYKKILVKIYKKVKKN